MNDITVDVLEQCCESGSKKAIKKAMENIGYVVYQYGNDIIKEFKNGNKVVLQTFEGSTWVYPEKMTYQL